MPRRDVTFERAERLFERAATDRGLCPVCFARQRRYLPDESAYHAHALFYNTNGKSTKDTMTSYGHGHDFEGNLDVDPTVVSEVDTSMYRDFVPATVIDGEYHRPQPKTVCTCGTVDYSRDDCRSLPMLYDAVENLHEWLGELDLTMYPPADDFDVEAAKAVVGLLRGYDCMSGQDQLVLTEALRRGYTAAME